MPKIGYKPVINWRQYFKRRTRASIVLDLTFVVLLITLLIPASRNAISRIIISNTLFQPAENRDIKYLDESCYDWKLRDASNKIVTLDSLKGKVLFINFWATWCPPCIAEMPSIENLNRLYGNRIAIILVSTESEDVVKEFIETNKYTFPIYCLANETPIQLFSHTLPTTFLISKNGRIVISRRGAAKWDGEKMQELIDRLLSE
jgi:thiol-disulfide isomerase/thioredoxin